MEEWKEYKLGDIISIKSGFAYKGKDIGFGSNFLLGMGCVSFKEKFLLVLFVEMRYAMLTRKLRRARKTGG